MKKKIGNYLLKQKLKKKRDRNTHFDGIQNTKEIGILFDATDYEDYKRIKQFEKELQHQGKKVVLLGYEHNKTKNTQYISDSSKGFINKKDFNWMNTPTEPFVEEFINKIFDVLFVFARDSYFPIHYVSLLSNAYFKVGCAGKNEHDFDLIMDMPSTASVEEQIKQMWYYLQLISHDKKQPEPINL
jgi:hypothetical protein